MQLSRYAPDRFSKFCSGHFLEHETCNYRYISEFLKDFLKDCLYSQKLMKNQEFSLLTSEALLAAYTPYFCMNFFLLAISVFWSFKKMRFYVPHMHIQSSRTPFRHVMWSKKSISTPYRPTQNHKEKQRFEKLLETRNKFFSKKQLETKYISKNEQKRTDRPIFSLKTASSVFFTSSRNGFNSSKFVGKIFFPVI